MVPVIIASAAGGTALVTLGGAARHRGRSRRGAEPPPVEARSSVRLLRDGPELADALQRAARREREAAEVRRRRADRYEAQILPAPVTDLRPGGRAGAGAPPGRTRSA